MSLVAHRHHRPGKRSFEDEGEEEQRGSHSTKARRLITAARHSAAAAPAHVPVTSSVIAGLRSLYPAMNEQVITAVLSDCGSDIDAAIRKLGQLQLQAERSAADGRPQPQSHSAPLTPASGSPVRKSGASELSSPQNSAALAAVSDATVGQQPQQQPQHAGPNASQQQQQQPQLRTQPETQQSQTLSPQPQTLPQPQQQQQGPQTPEEWVDALVASMQQATDVADARARAAQALQAFEQAVQGAVQATTPGSQQQLAALQRDNTILKRAVAIQNNRLQDLAGAAQQLAAKDTELAELRNVAKQYHDRVQALELSNFSLAQHLKQATDARTIDAGRHVF
mmetsp:Transcript_64/g.219  ORF Transcript_64/g.219 Transcript_64/m.219 type:complete len:338 (+) Transcript_64:350-1363(+)